MLFALERLEALLEPLLEASPHSEMTYALENSNKVLKGAMALLVKSAVVEELVHSILLSLFNERFE